MSAQICRPPADPGHVTTIAVTSGKGGVGKTNVAVNLGIALARLRNRVAILDADFALGNVDVLLGLAPARHLGHLLAGDVPIRDVLIEGPAGVRVIPACSGLHALTALAPQHWERLNAGLNEIRAELDFLIVDTGAGISSNVVDLLTSVERVMIVTSPEPTALVDAYALLKVLTAVDPAREVGVLVNAARDGGEADLVYRQLEVAAARFLHRRLASFGYVTQDPLLRECVLLQRPVIEQHPQAPASRCFRILASRVASLAPLGGPGLRLVPPPPDRPVSIAPLEASQCA
jgi:flagellar biosynthesis protein FlhG